MKRIIFGAFATLLLISPAIAGTGYQICDNSAPANCVTVTGNKLDVNSKASLGTGAYASATAGITDSTISVSPVYFLDIINTSPTATVCVNLGATATITSTTCAAGEITLPPLWHRSWENNFVPTDVIHVIASAASTQLSIGAK